MPETEQQHPTDAVSNPQTLVVETTTWQQDGETKGPLNGPSYNEQHERPSKRRRLTDSLTPQQQSSPRAPSPPWKRFEVDGPTTFKDQSGKRRSARTNALPLELQPQSGRRRTRAAGQQRGSVVTGKYASTPASKQGVKQETASHSKYTAKHARTASRASQVSAPSSSSRLRRQLQHIKQESPPATPTNKPRKHAKMEDRLPSTVKSQSKGRQKQGIVNGRIGSAEDSVRRTSRYTKGHMESAGVAESEDEDSGTTNPSASSEDDDGGMKDVVPGPNFKLQKVRFTVRKPTLSSPSYSNTLQFAKDIRFQRTKRNFDSIEEWLAWAVENGHQIFPGYDVYEGDDEYMKDAFEDNEERRRHREIAKRTRAPVASLSMKEAVEEGKLREDIEEGLKPGGRLHPETCTQFAPERFDAGRRQYAHWDHLLGHAHNFRRLLFKEAKAHQETARRLAYAAQEKWRSSQPKSQTEIEEEKTEAERAILSATMRQCVKDLTAKWDLLRAELEAIRLARYQEEQEALGKQKLNKVMEQSAQLLDARRRQGSSDLGSATEADDDDLSRSDNMSASENDETAEEDESNMSTSGSESEEAAAEDPGSDAGLTVEELRKKYEETEVHNLDRPPDEEDMGGDIDMANTPVCKGLAPPANGVEYTFNPKPVLIQEDMEELPVLDDHARRTYEEEAPDETDESIDMTDEESSEEDEQNDNSGSDESDGDEAPGLLSLFATKTQLKDMKTFQAQNEVKVETNTEALAPIMNDYNEDDEELEEVSLIPDAAQVQTPAASNDEGGPEVCRPEQYRERQSHLSVVTSSSPPVDLDPQATKQESQGVHELSMPATPVSSQAIKTPIPSLLRATLREYQHYGLDWLAGLYAKNTNGILADEMGLGKTIQTISLLAHIAEVHENWGPHLIVVPTSVMLNWEIEFRKFLPGFKILTYYGSPEERKAKRVGWLDDNKWNVVITSYQLVLQDQASFKRRAWRYMVLDEAHNIKNWKSARWQTLLGFRTTHRLLLTGTPLQNNLTELWSLMFFLMPYAEDGDGRPQFTGLEEFTSWFNKPVNQILEQGRGELTSEAKELVQRLHTILRPYLLRRLKADVEKQMPGKYEHVVYCKLSKRQRHLYDGFMSRASTRETLSSGNYLSIINCLMQLRKVCNHPDLFETRQIVTSFAMPRSAVADYQVKDLLIRRRLLQEEDYNKVALDAVNLLPAANSQVSATDTIQNRRLGAQYRLKDLIRRHHEEIIPDLEYKGTSLDDVLLYAKNRAHQVAADSLETQWQLLKMRSQARPLMAQGTVDFMRRKLNERRILVQEYHPSPVPPAKATTFQRIEHGKVFPLAVQPTSRVEYVKWLDYCTPVMRELSMSVQTRSVVMQPYIHHFACITPNVVAHDIDRLVCGKPGTEIVQDLQPAIMENAKMEIEPFHESQTRLSIAFPDKRLLQYDCGKLQRLDTLLRTLQAGGHRALIFTQMTKVLDILEQFLNIHGHRYLRLDGSTKIEQRQILTDRFNSDNRILAFILSSRSGGLGINLTGADTVIFYDLDWNPAMDKQCQDRCHRIGQTRDVHIYRFVSEYTIEANILRKANQKRLLDDVIIQDGDFTTDRFNQRDIEEDDAMHEVDAEASAAMDRVLGGGTSGENISTKLLAKAEDQEDVDAAQVAEKEGHTDDVDFNEKTSGASTRAHTPRTPGPRPMTEHSKLGQQPVGELTDGGEKPEFFTGTVQPRTEAGMKIFADKAGIGVDRYILEHLEWELKDVPVVPPEDRRSKKKGRKGERYSTKRRR